MENVNNKILLNRNLKIYCEIHKRINPKEFYYFMTKA